MKTIVHNIEDKNYTLVKEELDKKLKTIVSTKLHEMKKIVAAKQFTEGAMRVDDNNRVIDTGTLPSVDKLKRGLVEKKGDYELNPEQQKLAKGDPLYKKAFTSMNVVTGKPARRIQQRILNTIRNKQMSAAGYKGRTPEDAAKASKQLDRQHKILGRLAQSKNPDFADFAKRQQKVIEKNRE